MSACYWTASNSRFRFHSYIPSYTSSFLSFSFNHWVINYLTYLLVVSEKSDWSKIRIWRPIKTICRFSIWLSTRFTWGELLMITFRQCSVINEALSWHRLIQRNIYRKTFVAFQDKVKETILEKSIEVQEVLKVCYLKRSFGSHPEKIS